jgi:hypothetical protein
MIFPSLRIDTVYAGFDTDVGGQRRTKTTRPTRTPPAGWATPASTSEARFCEAAGFCLQSKPVCDYTLPIS